MMVHPFIHPSIIWDRQMSEQVASPSHRTHTQTHTQDKISHYSDCMSLGCFWGRYRNSTQKASESLAGNRTQTFCCEATVLATMPTSEYSHVLSLDCDEHRNSKNTHTERIESAGPLCYPLPCVNDVLKSAITQRTYVVFRTHPLGLRSCVSRVRHYVTAFRFRVDSVSEYDTRSCEMVQLINSCRTARMQRLTRHNQCISHLDSSGK